MTQLQQHSTNPKILENRFWLEVPIRAVVYPTSVCNYRCNHCYASDFANKYIPELTLQDYKPLFQRLKQWGVFEVVFLGGEPLLRKDFLDIAYIARDAGLGIKFSTNGSLITENNVKKIHELFDGRLQVSLESSRQDVNNRIRGETSFVQTINGMHLLQNNETDFSLGIVLSRINSPYLNEMYEFVNNLGIKGLHIMRIMPKGRGLKNWGSLGLTNAEWVRAVKNLRSIAVKGKSKLQIDGTYEYSISTEPLGKCISGCEAGRYEITIMSNGVIVPCDMFDNIQIGNIKLVDFESEWKENNVYKRFRGSKSKLEGKCSHCEIDFCVGCRYQSYIINGNFNSEDPFCVRDFMKNE